MTAKKSDEEKAVAAEEKALDAVEAHINPDDATMPDHTGIRKVEAHRQAQVGEHAEVETGDDSSVNPQPDRDAPGVPVSFAPTPEEHQITEQPDLYAVGNQAQEYAEPKKRGGRRKKDDDSSSGESLRPAQYGDGDEQPAQYSF